MLSVRSGSLTALRQGKPESFWRKSCTAWNETFWSSSGCRFFTSSAVNWGFFFFLSSKVSAACKVFLLLPPPILCFGTALQKLHNGRSCSSFTFKYYFYWYFFLLQARIQAFSALLLYFPGMLKWYFQKQTPHWWSIQNYLLHSKIPLSERCLLKT